MNASLPPLWLELLWILWPWALMALLILVAERWEQRRAKRRRR